MSQYIQFENFLFVEVAPDAHSFEIYDGTRDKNGFIKGVKGDLIYKTKLNVWNQGDAILPPGNWEIVCVSNELPMDVKVFNAIQRAFVTYDRFLILKQSK